MALLRVQAPQIIGIMNPNKFAINFKTLPFRFMAIELDVYFGDFISPNYWKTLALWRFGDGEGVLLHNSVPLEGTN